MKSVRLGTEEFAEYGKTDTVVLVLTINKTEANAIIDDICELEGNRMGVTHSSKALRAILAPIAGIPH